MTRTVLRGARWPGDVAWSRRPHHRRRVGPGRGWRRGRPGRRRHRHRRPDQHPPPLLPVDDPRLGVRLHPVRLADDLVPGMGPAHAGGRGGGLGRGHGRARPDRLHHRRRPPLHRPGRRRLGVRRHRLGGQDHRHPGPHRPRLHGPGPEQRAACPRTRWSRIWTPSWPRPRRCTSGCTTATGSWSPSPPAAPSASPRS